MWTDHDTLRKVKWLIVLRVLFVSGLLGSLIFAQKAKIASPDSFYPLYAIIILTYLLTILYAILLNWITNIQVFAGVQIAFDVIIETAIIYVTGGTNSVFQFLYIISIITASLMLTKILVFLIASLSGIFYASILYGLAYNILPAIGLTAYAEHTDILALSHTVLIHITAFYIVALLSTNLTASLKKKEVELKKVKINMRELQLLTDTIIDTMGSGLLILNNDGDIEIFNKCALEILEIKKRQEKIAELHIEDVLPGINSDKIISTLKNKQEKRICFETTITTPSGKKNLTLSFVGLFNEDKVLYGAICTFQDITQIKKMERLMASKEKFATIGEIASNLVHEIKNPLGAIRSSVQMLGEDIKAFPQEQSLINLIIREVDRLNTLLQEFLCYVRLSNKKMECFNLKKLVFDIIRLLKNSKYYRKEITINTKLHGQHLIIKWNQTYLRTIIWNLALNALQAIEGKGKVEITIDIHPGLVPGIYHNNHSTTSYTLILKVTDTGAGMDQETQEKIFQPFFSTKDEGSGLGLSVISRIVEEERGKILVESIPMVGTTFTVFLPVTVP